MMTLTVMRVSGPTGPVLGWAVAMIGDGMPRRCRVAGKLRRGRYSSRPLKMKEHGNDKDHRDSARDHLVWAMISVKREGDVVGGG